jgi:hypothetical protein
MKRIYQHALDPKSKLACCAMGVTEADSKNALK